MVIQVTQQFFRVVVFVIRAINQVDPKNPEGFLLQTRIGFLKTDVERYLIVIFIGLDLVFDPNPTMSFELLGKIDRCDRIGITKKHFIRMLFAAQTAFNQVHLVRKHFFQTAFGYITAVFFNAIDCVAEILVISRHRLRNRTRRTAGTEEMAHRFLAGANLCKSAVNVFVQVDSQRFVLDRWDRFNDFVAFKFNFNIHYNRVTIRTKLANCAFNESN